MGDTEEQYEFSSPPRVPREKVGDILVKFQAVSPTNPCLLAKSYKLSSNEKVLSVRRKIQFEFDQLFENGFVFLCKNTEILTSRERTLTLKDILPKAGLGKPTLWSNHSCEDRKSRKNSFQYPPDISYKQLRIDIDGRGHEVTCIGLLFLCDASGVSHWNPNDLRQRLDAHSSFGFTFIPSDITSARADVNESLIEEINQYAAVCKLETKKKKTEDSDEIDEQQKKGNFAICRERIETLLKSSRIDEEKLKDRRLATPLHYAAQGGHLKMCQFLCMRFDKTKLLYEQDIHGRTPLHCALSRIGVRSSKKHLEVVAYLLTYVNDPDSLNSCDETGLSCYNMIMSLKKEDTIFLMALLDPDMIDQKLVLYLCCCALQYRVLTQAIRYCESVGVVKPTFLRPPLHLAAEFGNKDVVVKLLNAGHKVLDRDPDGNLPFHYACQHGQTEFVKFLYGEGMENSDLEKGVRLALFRRKFGVLGKIAEVAPIIDLPPDLSRTLSIQAEQNLKKHGRSILGCLMKGSEAQKDQNILALTPFISQAASHGLTDLLDDLLKICPPSYSDEMSRTPLHEAVQGIYPRKHDSVRTSMRQSNCLQAFKVLVKETKTLDVVDWRASTPLHYACMEGNLEFIKFMMSKKDLKFASMTDSVGRTPLLIAAHYQKGRKSLDFLINHHLEHLKPYAMDMYGKNILHYIGYMKSGTVDILLNKMKKMQHTSTGPYQPKGFCSPPNRQIHQNSQTPKALTEFIVKTEDNRMKCRYCDEKLQGINGTHYCQFLFQTLPATTDASSLETLIVMNKPELLKKLIKEMPYLAEGDIGLKASFLAVKMWRHKCAEILMKCVPKESINIDKYLLASLEMKPTLVLMQPDTPSVQSCRLRSLRMKQDETEAESQRLMVRYLLKMGANPCYIPTQSGYKVGSKHDMSFFKYNGSGNFTSPPRLNEDIPGSLRRYCTALEKAIIFENDYIVSLFLEQPQTRVRESFAVHLAAKAGNAELLEKLLKKLKKEHRAYGKAETELAFVSTLQNGILGAACGSEKPSFALYEVIHRTAPEIFKGTKLLTAKLLANSRPVMIEILKVHDHLPLVLFMRKQQQNLNSHEKERIACFILQNGSYPVEMRTRKRSFIHPVCDMFISAHRQRMWKVLAVLIQRSGSTLWKCIFGTNEDKMKCHHRLYTDKADEAFRQKNSATNPRLGDILQHFTSAPVEIVSMFTHAGLRTLTTLDQHIKDDLLEYEFSPKDSVENDTGNPSTNIQALFLERMIPMLWIKPMNALLSTDIRPKKWITDYSSNNIKQMWSPSFVDCETTSLANLQSVRDVIEEKCSQISLPLLDCIIHVRRHALFKKEKAKYVSLERSLIYILKRIRPNERRLPALYLAVAFGDRDLVDHIIRTKSDVSLLDDGSTKNLLDLASRKADLPMVKLLTKHGSMSTDLTLQYAALSRSCFFENIIPRHTHYDPYLNDPCGSKLYRSEEEENQIRLCLVKYLCESMLQTDKDSSPRYTEVLRKAAKGKKWILVNYLLDVGATVLDLPQDGHLTDISEDEGGEFTETSRQNAVLRACEGLLAILSNASSDLALKTLRTINEVMWDKQSLYLSLTAAARSNKVIVVKHLLQEVLFRTPSPVDNPDDIRDVLCMEVIKGENFGTVFHFLCRNGDIGNVKVIVTNLKDKCNTFIDVLHKQCSSPLWYAVAYEHMRLAEFLLLNGAAPDCPRAVPDLYVKRTGYAEPEKKAKITTIKQFGLLSRDSRGVADALESKSDVFLKPQDLMKLKKKSKSYAHISQGKHKTRSLPRCAMAKRVEVLMNLARVGKSVKGTIFHAAVIEGDITLMKEIQSQPMFELMMRTSQGVSAGLLALAHQNTKTISECRKYPEIMGDPNEVVRRACQVIISFSASASSEIIKLGHVKKAKKSSIKTSEDSGQDLEAAMEPIAHSLYDILVTNYMEGRKLRYFSFCSQNSLEELIKELTDILPFSDDQEVPDEFLLALAVLCNSKVFNVFVEKLKTNQRKTDVTSRHIIKGCTLTDLTILLSSQREMKEICHSLDALAKIDVLHINDTVLMFAIKRNMTSVLRIIAESIFSKTPEKLLKKLWLDAFVLAASKGDNALLKVLMKNLDINNPSKLDDVVDKALCVSCSRGYSDIVELLTSFASRKGILNMIDLYEALKQAAKYGRVQVVKKLLKVCQKNQKLNIDLLIKLLKRTKFNGSRTFFQTVFDFGEETFRTEKDKLTKEVPTVLLQSAKHGHEQLCLYILEKYPDVNLKQKSRDRKKDKTVKGQKRVINQNNKDACVLHYACERGLMKLALKLLEKDPQLAEEEDRDKRKPVQYASLMGEVGLLHELSVQYDIKLIGERGEEIMFFGSLRHCVTKNAGGSSETAPVLSRVYPTRRRWTIENALEYKDEEAALSMFYSAEHSYRESRLIHKASRNGCAKVLAAIFKTFEKDPDILRTDLLTEAWAGIPMALAVEGKHIECVRLLKEKHDFAEWSSSTTKETIFHFAARANDVAILDILLENTDPQAILVPDKYDIAPGLLSTALGHHQLGLRFFKQGYPQNLQHRSHKDVNHTCLECLFDRCIGWSKMYLSQQHVSQSSTKRDIWERRGTSVGFISEGNTMTHILERLLEYADMSKNTSIVQTALVCMGYESNLDTARLFLLQSKEGKEQIKDIKHCLSQGWETTAIAILKNLDKREGGDFYGQVLDLAIASNSMEVVRYMIQDHPDLIYNKDLYGFTAIGVAVSLQRYDIYFELMSQVPQDDVQGCFTNLSDIKVCIPLRAQWLSGIAYPGDETWLESIQDSRFSDANCLMVYNNNSKLKEKLESSSKLTSMFPEKVLDKLLTVDVESFKRGSPVPATESWLMAVVASYIQTLKSVLEEANQLEDVDVVELSCLPSSNKVPFMEVSGRSLRDRVKLDSSGMKEPFLFIRGSERLPNKFHQDAHFKKLVETDVIPEAENLAADITGHKVKVKVDWPSFSADHNEETKTTVYRILAGRDPNSALGGLVDVLRRCKDICDDIFAMLGDVTVNSIRDLFLPLREIVVKHSGSTSKSSKILFCLIDQSLPWIVNYKDDDLVYLASNFPLYSILKACHSVCVCMSDGLREFHLEAERRSSRLSPNKWLEKEIRSKNKMSDKEKPRLEPHIDWKSFGALGDTTALCVLGRNGIRLEMLRLAAGFKHLMWYKCNPQRFVLKNVPLSSQADLSIDETTVTISICANRSHNAGWVSTGLDIYARLHDLEIKWLLENDWIKIKSVYKLPEVVNSFGWTISVPDETERWFEEIVRRDNRQMERPTDLLLSYMAQVRFVLGIEEETDNNRMSPQESLKTTLSEESIEDTDEVLQEKKSRAFSNQNHTGLAKVLEESLIMCPGVWPVQEMDIIPGLWFWLTTAELQNGISYDKFLVKFKEQREGVATTVYKVMSKQDARSIDSNSVSGVWYYQSYDKRTDSKMIMRLQLMSFNAMIYLITDPLTVQGMLLKIPSTIKMGLVRNAEEDDSVLFVQFGSWINAFDIHTRLRSGLDRVYVDNRALYDCWNRCSEFGINVIIDTEDIRQAGVGSSVMEQIAYGTALSLEQFIQKNDLTTRHLCANLISSQGVMLVGRTNPLKDEKAAWVAEGSSKDDKYFTIYPLSKTDIFVSYEKALTTLTKSKDKENSVYISSVYPAVLNLAFGHKVVQTANMMISMTLNHIGAPGNSKAEVSFLETSSDDIFIPQARIVSENITTSITFLASVSRAMKDKLTRVISKVIIKKTNSESDFNVVKYHKNILTIFAVNKEMPLPLEDIAKAMLEAFGVEQSSLNADVYNERFIRLTPVGYRALCPSKGSNSQRMKVTDVLGKELTEEQFHKFKPKILKVVLWKGREKGNVVESTTTVINDSKEIRFDYDIHLDDVRDNYFSDNIVTIQLGENKLLGPSRVCGLYEDSAGVMIGKRPNQIVLAKNRSPSFLLFSKHEHACWGTSNDLTAQEDKHHIPGYFVENRYLVGTMFEITYAAGRRKCLDTIACLSEGLYKFKFQFTRQRTFIRARCRQCRSYLNLHTKVSSVPAGDYLEVVHAPSSLDYTD